MACIKALVPVSSLFSSHILSNKFTKFIEAVRTSARFITTDFSGFFLWITCNLAVGDF